MLLAVFKKSDKFYQFLDDYGIGGKWIKFEELNSIKNGIIICDAKFYIGGGIFFNNQPHFEYYGKDVDTDAACCPSLEGKSHYILVNDRIAEIYLAHDRTHPYK